MFQDSHFDSNHFRLKGTDNKRYSSFFVLGGEGLFFFTIGGKSALQYLVPSTLGIEQNVNNRSTASFELLGIDGYIPKVGEEVIMEIAPCVGESFVRQFAGYIAEIESAKSYCGRTMRYEVSCVDFTAVLDRRVVFQIYETQPLQDVIEKIVETFLDGENITTKNVDTGGTTLQKIVCSYIKTSKVFNDITTATGYHYYIDYYKDLHFFKRSSRKSKIFLDVNCEPNADEFCAFLNDESCNKGIRWADISMNTRSDELINKAYMIAGWDETKVLTEKFVGDGERRTFNLKYPLSQILSLEGGAIDPTAIDVTPATFPMSIGVRDDDPENVAFTFTKGEHEITMGEDETAFPSLTGGQVLTVKYKGQYKVVVQQKNDGSINTQKELENTSGLYMYVEDDETVESEAYAQEYINGVIDRYSKIPIRISVKSDVHLIKVAETLSASIPDYGISQYDGNNFLVNSVSITEIESKIFRYNYNLISTQSLGDWQEFFKRIEQFGRQLKLREQTKITFASSSSEGVTEPEIDEETGEEIWKWNAEQKFTWEYGADTDEQAYETEVCFLHNERAFHNNNYHCIPQVRVLDLE